MNGVGPAPTANIIFELADGIDEGADALLLVVVMAMDATAVAVVGVGGEPTRVSDGSCVLVS
jgi:hypothetical protein